jgi:hypothetical protein
MFIADSSQREEYEIESEDSSLKCDANMNFHGGTMSPKVRLSSLDFQSWYLLSSEPGAD